MKTNESLVHALAARGVTPHDLEDIVHALILDMNAGRLARTSDETGRTMLTRAFAMETKSLTAAGLHAQVSWMACYFNNRENLEWSLAGYLNLPLAA